MIPEMSNFAVRGILPNAVRSATAIGADFDVSSAVGQGLCILDAGAQGSGITLNVKLQESAAAVLGAAYQVAGDADSPLNKSTSGKTKIAASFTQSGAKSVKSVTLQLKKAGTIAADKVLTLTIEADSSGPSGTPLATAATVLANSIGSAYESVTFTFSTPVDLADATKYWIVLTSNYTASDTNFINWSQKGLASGGNAATYAPSAWTADATNSLLFYAYQYSFSDVASGALAEVGNAAALKTLAVNLDAVKGVVRGVATVAGGTATGDSSLVLVHRNAVM